MARFEGMEELDLHALNVQDPHLGNLVTGIQRYLYCPIVTQGALTHFHDEQRAIGLRVHAILRSRRRAGILLPNGFPQPPDRLDYRPGFRLKAGAALRSIEVKLR
jgi:hypothetical protein